VVSPEIKVKTEFGVLTPECEFQTAFELVPVAVTDLPAAVTPNTCGSVSCQNSPAKSLAATSHQPSVLLAEFSAVAPYSPAIPSVLLSPSAQSQSPSPSEFRAKKKKVY
jgi:hypothetical protein